MFFQRQLVENKIKSEGFLIYPIEDRYISETIRQFTSR